MEEQKMEEEQKKKEENVCEICGAKLTEDKVCRDLYHELSFYSLTHPNKDFFIHQYVVDTYTAQHASKEFKPIKNAFALIGLCLLVNYNYNGRQIQQAHMELAKTKRSWPMFLRPEAKAEITISDILLTKTYSSRDELIKKWATSVWQMYKADHQAVMQLVLPYIESKKHEKSK